MLATREYVFASKSDRSLAAPVETGAHQVAQAPRHDDREPDMTAPESPEAGAHSRVDLVSSVLLAAATLCSAWCAYQASVWNGTQTRALAATSVAQFSAERQASLVNRNVSIDVGVFLRYVDADLHHDKDTAEFLRTHARPEFRPAFEAWIADVEAKVPHPPLPFVRPEYKLAAQDRIDDSDKRAQSNLMVSNAANDNSDAFVLHTVLFAMSLMFLGATAQAHRRRAQLTMLVFGALSFTATFISMARLPRATHNDEHMAIR
jgi:hypothetical protein